MRFVVALAAALALAAPAAAETLVLGPHRYGITTGVTFGVANQSSNSYLFSWSDESGARANVVNPTLVLWPGQTYAFRRVSAKHPLVIADGSLPVSGTDGAYLRTTSERTVLDAAILQPLADFTADPAPTSDAIVWALTDEDAGTYYYTCDVPAHRAMTGQIVVGAGGVAAVTRSWSSVKALFR